LAPAQQIQPKDELVDVIRGLRMHCLDSADKRTFVGKERDIRRLYEPLRFLEQKLVQGNSPMKGGLQDREAHKLLVTSLMDIGDGLGRSGSVAEALRAGQIDMAAMPGGAKMEEYMSAFLPSSHLVRCEAFTSAADVLSDALFIGRRVHSLGIVEATSRQVADLQELRRVAGNATFTIPGKGGGDSSTPKKTGPSGVW
jgi:hypothetical protein